MLELIEYAPYLIIGLIVVVTILAFVISNQRTRARREGLSRQATLMGLTYAEEGSSDRQAQLPGFHLFEEGHSKVMRNVMEGRYRAVDLTTFDYHYSTGHGKNRNNFYQTVALFHFDRDPLPPFVLKPEHVFLKIGQVFGMQDIDFTQNQEFSKRYLLQGADEQEVRQTFRSYILDYFQRHEGWNVEGGGEWLVAYRHKKRVKPEELTAFLDRAVQIGELFAH
jgi:hypothetical protein